jgi:hypothetical protein
MPVIVSAVLGTCFDPLQRCATLEGTIANRHKAWRQVHFRQSRAIHESPVGKHKRSLGEPTDFEHPVTLEGPTADCLHCPGQFNFAEARIRKCLFCNLCTRRAREIDALQEAANNKGTLANPRKAGRQLHFISSSAAHENLIGKLKESLSEPDYFEMPSTPKRASPDFLYCPGHFNLDKA